MATRVLFIGLDAYDKDLLLQWAESGVLPNLGSLLQESTWGVTRNPPGLYAGSVWESFMTGVSPARHRRFFRHQARRGEYIDTRFGPEDLQARPFWESLSRAGRRVAILDVPHAPLSPTLNGILLVDWSTHEPSFNSAASYPPSLVSESARQSGQPAPDRCDDMERTPAGLRAFLDSLETRIHNTLELSLQYLRAADWDFFATAFSAAHCVGHQCWHLHDPTHPQYDASLAACAGDPLEVIYRQLDDAVGQLLAAVDDTTTVIVLASHGMGPFCAASVVLDDILRRLDQQPAASSGSMYGRLKHLWYRLPTRLRGAALLRAAKGRLAPSLHNLMLFPDRQARRYFAIPNNPHAGAIRINLAGREAHGIVHPEEYRALCQQLREELLALVDPATGARTISDVLLVADVYDGPYVDELPDLLVEWNRASSMSAIHSPRIGTLLVPELIARSGDHRPEGLFCARGPELVPARLGRAVSVMDFAPTIAARLGVPLDGIEGRPIPELAQR